MKVYGFSLGPLQTNCYFLTRDSDLIIIDPVDEGSFLLEEISRKNLNLVAMIATHGHFDHVMAAGEIQLAFQGKKEIPFYVHPKDQFLINRINETAEYFLGYDPQALPPLFTQDLSLGKQKIKGFSFSVLHTPGHTPGSCSLYFPNENCVFSGDVLFKGSVGRSDFSYSSKSDLKKSVQTVLDLPPTTKVYSGHGEETIVGEEQEADMLLL